MDLDAISHVRLFDPITLCVRWGCWSLHPRERLDLGIHALANCCLHLSDKNEERFRIFVNYFGGACSGWFDRMCMCVCVHSTSRGQRCR